jgi:hypothetical protein
MKNVGLAFFEFLTLEKNVLFDTSLESESVSIVTSG